MSVNKLKELIQPFVKIPMVYLKIFRKLQMENDERLVIELGLGALRVRVNLMDV